MQVFWGKIYSFLRNCICCLSLIQLIQAAEKEGTKAESSFLFYKLNAEKESVDIKI